MVVLEEGSMLTTGHNQYLQPDYLSPLPTTLDAKKSPLALLAQTCSQIGSDSPTKPLISSLEKTSKGPSHARSPPAAKLERTRGSPSDGSANSNKSSSSSSSSASLAFKPYETNVVAKSRSSDDMSRPASKSSSVHSVSESANNVSVSNASETTNHELSLPHKKRSTPHGRKSASPATNSAPAAITTAASSGSPSGSDRRTPGDRDKTSVSPRANSGASPIIRSGMEILSGQSAAAKDAAAAAASLQSMYKASGLPFGAANSLCCPPGIAENPAFRPPFAGASPFSHHHAAAAAALLGYPSAAGSPTNNPYLSYARVKTPSGGETLVPVCKDPYCTGCQYSMHNAQMMMAAAAAGAASQPCPSGCTQCDHQKYGLMSALSMPPPSLAGYQSSLAAASAAAAAAASNGRLHVCNWAVDNSYCGKRFSSSEELLQHLRTHTSTDPAAAAALLASQHAHPLLSPSAALHRAAASSYPAPSLSPLSARYHPYGKPPGAGGPLPASLAASPYSAFNALGPYYSPYAIYGQRLGAAVHP